MKSSKFMVQKTSILITGGLGFIGSHLVKKLISKNYYPIIIDDFSNANIDTLKSLPKSKYYLIKCDINNKKVIEKRIKNLKPVAIVHLAATCYVPYCIKNPKKTKRVNVNGTKSILEIARKFKTKKFIFSSSAFVYKSSKKPLKENNLDEPTDIYGKSKKQAEKIIYDFSKNYNGNFIVMRLFNVYGKNDLTPHFIPSIIKRIKSSNKIATGNLDTRRDYINVWDVVRAILMAIEKPSKKRYSVYNIGTGKSFSGKKITDILGILTKKNIMTIPNKSLFRKIDIKCLIADINKFSNEYHWKPVISIKKGLKELLYD